MKKLFFFVFCFFCVLSFGSVCQAEEVATGSAVTSEFDSNNFSTELDDLEISDLIKVFSIGLASGIGLITILYIFAIAIASFFTITEFVDDK